MNNKREKILLLIKNLNKWNYEYYVNNNSIVSDEVYDANLKELIKLEKQNPKLIFKNSPTRLVGVKIAEGFDKVEHKDKMLSLNNAFNLDDLKQFDNQIKKFIKKPFEYICELKIDGLSISISYKNHNLYKGVTRGDGYIGEDVTNNILKIKSIPKIIAEKDITINGEVYMKKSIFQELNKKRQENSLKLLANPRNAASGTIRNLDSSILNKRQLDLFAYNISLPINSNEINTQSSLLEFLKNIKIPINNNYKVFNTIEKVYEYCLKISNEKESFDYPIDGIVIKVNQLNLHSKIGRTSKAPKWAIAYKMPADISETQIIDIFHTVGRTGKITYNAKLLPVQLAGTIVKAATLHNYDFILNKDIRIHDFVNIQKAGDIIPEIINVNFEKRINHNQFKPFHNCPSCNSILVKIDKEVDQYCLNKNCSYKIIRQIEHFTSRNALNIQGFSIQTIEKFYNHNIINSWEDIYNLENHKDKILNLEGFGEKSYNNLIENIDKSKQREAFKVLYGLGIKHIGLKTSKILFKYLNNFKEIFESDLETLSNLSDIGPVIANSIKLYYAEHSNIIDKIKDIGLKKEYINNIQNKSLLNNKKIAISGKLLKPRSYYINLIEQFNGKIVTSISSKTNYLLIGEKAGSKKQKAKENNVKIINENELLELLKKGD